MAALTRQPDALTGQDPLDIGIRALVPAPLEGGQILYAATRDGAAAYRPVAGGPLATVDTVLRTGQVGADLAVSEPVSGPASLLWPGGEGRFDGQEIAADGGFGAPVAFAPAPASLALAGDGAWLYAAGPGGIGAYRLEGGGATRLALLPADDGAEGCGDAVLAVAGPGVFAACGSGDAVMALRLDMAAGRIEVTGRIGAAEGLGIAAPVAVVPVRQGGADFLVVAAAGSSSLSVLQVGAGGALAPVDHVIDSRATRFAQVQSLSAVEFGDLTYLAAGGGDGGFSLFTLLPDGRLVHLEAVAVPGPLAALAALAIGDEMQIAAAFQDRPGLSLFTRPVTGRALAGGAGAESLAGGDGDDVVFGGGGDDTLRGGGGDDVLADGAGRDILTGGAGADIFVLSADGAADVITDFQPGRDRLDLSAWPRLYDPGAVDLRPTAWGARIVHEGEILDLRRDGGGGLSARDVFGSGFLTPDRPPLLITRFQTGTPAPDTLTGDGGSDQIRGLDGADRIFGGGGPDTLAGEAGADSLFAGDGADLVWGGPGDDLIWGGAGGDLLHGGAGADRIFAAGGGDSVWGGDGRDRVFLGAGDDAFFDTGQGGAAGRDTVFGGAGNDTIQGGAGGDEFHGGAGNDLILGRLDDDRIHGGTGFDTLAGGAGDDSVWGGEGRDRVFLGTGDDLFVDTAQGGELGRDTVFGGIGDDTIQGGAGGDVFHGGGGADVIFARLGADRVHAGAGDDRVYLGAGDDTVFGGSGRNSLFLGAGDDLVFAAAAGRDTIFGGAGADTIRAGAGDLAAGGAGADRFVFAGPGRIADFTPGEDLLVLEGPPEGPARAVTEGDGGAGIPLSGGGWVILQGISAADLSAADILWL